MYFFIRDLLKEFQTLRGERVNCVYNCITILILVTCYSSLLEFINIVFTDYLFFIVPIHTESTCSKPINKLKGVKLNYLVYC